METEFRVTGAAAVLIGVGVGVRVRVGGGAGEEALLVEDALSLFAHHTHDEGVGDDDEGARDYLVDEHEHVVEHELVLVSGRPADSALGVALGTPLEGPKQQHRHRHTNSTHPTQLHPEHLGRRVSPIPKQIINMNIGSCK